MTSDNYINRCALGAFLRHWRGSQSISVEDAVKLAGLSHMSWRRMEEGNSAWARTYDRVEKCLGIPSGLISRALTDDISLVTLAAHLGIDTSEAQASPTEFIRSFVKIGREDLFDLSADVQEEKMNTQVEIGKAVTGRRGQLGMTQADLARKTGISDITLRKLEKGTSRSYQARTLIFVERALRWTEGVLQSALDSGVVDPDNWTNDESSNFIEDDKLAVESTSPELNQNSVSVDKDLLYRAAIALYRYATDSTLSVPRRDEVALADEIYEAIRKDAQL